MNCAHHADQSAVAYCRTCGKALCANCTRPVRGVIYCEECLGAKMETGAPAAGFVAGGAVPPVPPAPPFPTAGSSGPNPTVAGILAGFFPFGVGAVYSGQYAKGLAHLMIAFFLVFGTTQSWPLNLICGLGCGFFYVYQIIDAVRSAKALQMAQPVPDPFGLAATFGAGSKVESNKIPMGAIVLILLGVLFLLHTMGLELGLDRFWPLILIGIGGWLFARNWGIVGGACAGRCQCARCRSGRITGPAVMVTLGFLFLFESVGGVGFHRTWPILLLVIGGVKLFQSSASADGHVTLAAPEPPATPVYVVPPPAPPAPPAPTDEVNRG
jgi:TM2 domain-containing membrane protein YozV